MMIKTLNKSLNILNIISISCIWIAGISCRSPKEFVYKDYKNFRVDAMGFSSTAIRVDLIYTNPNNFGLQLKKTDLEIFVNDNYLGRSAQDLKIFIPKKSDFELPLKIDVDMKNIFKNALASLISEEVTIKVIGKVTVGKVNIYKSIPISYIGKHKFSML